MRDVGFEAQFAALDDQAAQFARLERRVFDALTAEVAPVERVDVRHPRRDVDDDDLFVLERDGARHGDDQRRLNRQRRLNHAVNRVARVAHADQRARSDR